MKRYIISIGTILASVATMMAQNVIRVNQMGYLEDDIKVAVMLIDKDTISPQDFSQI